MKKLTKTKKLKWTEKYNELQYLDHSITAGVFQVGGFLGLLAMMYAEPFEPAMFIALILFGFSFVFMKMSIDLKQKILRNDEGGKSER